MHEIAMIGRGKVEAIEPARYRLEDFPEVRTLRRRRDEMRGRGLSMPYFRVQEGISRDSTVIAGRHYLNFSSHNYLGLSGDPEVTRAAAHAAIRYGTSVSASRIASGERAVHRELEAALARFLGCEDAIALVSGHATNVSVLGHLLGPEDLIVHDALAHDSILGGARLSGARRRPFAHNDMDALEDILATTRPEARRVLIAVEGVYSMDGDLAPLDRLIELKRKYKAILLVDEAHSLGVVGRTGRGIGEHYRVDRGDVDLWMGTLSKSLASCGGTSPVRRPSWTTPSIRRQGSFPAWASRRRMPRRRWRPCRSWRRGPISSPASGPGAGCSSTCAAIAGSPPG